MATRIFYLVFLLPIIFSFVFGGAVLGQVLQEPDRELNMWQFGGDGTGSVSTKSVKILGLESGYSTTEPVSVQISVASGKFDCGDLYITISDLSTNEVITQSGFFDQCYVSTNSVLPSDGDFSETIDTPGDYELKVEINSKSQEEFASVTRNFSVS